MNLTDREKEMLKGMLDRGEPLPPKYRATLFADAREVELIWQGKTEEVTNVVLPFQSIEHIDEPRKELNTQEGGDLGLFSVDRASGRQSGGWANKLIWGDNKLVLSSLKNGPLRKEIEDAGGLKLVYIDPPFDVGADFSVNIEVGEDTLVKQPSMIEELAYRDTWGKGADSYLSMMLERLSLIRDLIARDGSIYVHCDWRVNSALRLLLDEVFGGSCLRNQISWKRTSSHGGSDRYGNVTDSLLYYIRSDDGAIWNQGYQTVEAEHLERHYSHADARGTFALGELTAPGTREGPSGDPWRGFDVRKIGRHWANVPETMDALDRDDRIYWPKKEGGWPRLKRYLDDHQGRPATDFWDDISPLNMMAIERTDYATQKPEALLERVIQTSSSPGDLVADFFCGSGTTVAVAERLQRRWIGVDLGRFAIHTTRKRLIGIQRELKAKGEPYRAFEILNLGKYERQYFVGVDMSLPEAGRHAQSLQREEHYLSLILSAYKAERVFQAPPFHGRKGATVVVVGPIDAPVTRAQVDEAVAACRTQKIGKLDILGFEFEMGLCPAAQDEARQRGVTLALRYIPRDVFDRRAVERGQVQFYDVAYVEVTPKVEKQAVKIQLKDFGVFYRQDDADALAESLRPGGTKVTVYGGQVVKVSKDKKGVVSSEVLTKKWTDWIDYWSVDFDYESRKEIVRVVEQGEEREAWTGGYIFENEWQSYRTRKDRTLELVSAKHEYKEKRRYKIAVKVIDIFGNDTTKVIEVRV